MKSFIPLDSNAILLQLNELKPELANMLQFTVLDTVDSTNQFLKNQRVNSNHIHCCLAEGQTKGRGRFGRHWHSPHGENIYCSISIPFSESASELSGLSLVTSLAINHVMQLYIKTPIQIKWPNDLLIHHKKLAGTLIELSAEFESKQNMIIGIGININESFIHTKQPWCSLKDVAGKPFDRNQIIAELLSTIYTYLIVFKAKGFSAFQDEWNTLDSLRNKTIDVNQPGQTITGIALGTDNKGYLIVKDKKGVIHTLSAGDTSLKKY